MTATSQDPARSRFAYFVLAFAASGVVAAWLLLPRYIDVVVIFAVCMVGAWLISNLGHSGTMRRKTVVLIIMFLLLTSAFAAVYEGIFRASDNRAFVLSTELKAEQNTSQSARYDQQIDASEDILRAVDRILRTPHALHRCLAGHRGEYGGVTDPPPGTPDRYDRRIPLADHAVLVCERRTFLEEPFPEKPAIKVRVEYVVSLIVQMDRESGGGFLSIRPPGGEGKTQGRLKHLADKLLSARNEAEALAALKAFSATEQQIQGQAMVERRHVRDNRPSLDFSNFLYFSAAIMTTVGSQDIIPNSWQIRYMVVFQAFVAVFFIGFAVHLLWPTAKHE